MDLRVLVVDDEQLARDELCFQLDQLGGLVVVGQAGNGIEAVESIQRLKPELVFLDVQMPAISGLELLSMIDDDELPNVVFVTAHDEYALRAFEERALDYLLKPVAKERLAKTVERLRRLAGPTPAAAYPRDPIRRIPCLSGRAIKLVDVADVELVRSSEGGVYVVSAKGELFTELTLKVLEERAGLVRCHKQFLVNLDQVDEISVEDGVGVIRTRSGKDVPVSRRYLTKLRQQLEI
jgi:two-component system LytT family response regulator